MPADLDARHKLMCDMRDDAKARGPELQQVAEFYAREAYRLARERVQERMDKIAAKLKGAS